MVVDTPGLREIQLWDIQSLASAFPDIEDLAGGCRFRDCRHEQEPKCAVKTAVEDGRLDAGRLESYLRLRREAEFMARKQDEGAQAAEKRKWKIIHKAARNMDKRNMDK
jgi:ribosome biogenesis GTPase